jgi:hypothetical protein
MRIFELTATYKLRVKGKSHLHDHRRVNHFGSGEFSLTICKFLDFGSINCFRLQLAVGKDTKQSSNSGEIPAGPSGKVIKGKHTCLMCAVKVKKKRLEHHMAEKCPSKILWNRLDAATRAKLLANEDESCQPKQAGLVKTRPSGYFWFFLGFFGFFCFFCFFLGYFFYIHLPRRESF